jgi:type VI protein secretion system component VasF
LFVVTNAEPSRDIAPAASRRSNHRRPLHIRAPLMALFVVGAVCTVVATYILHTGADQTTAGTLLVYGWWVPCS